MEDKTNIPQSFCGKGCLLDTVSREKKQQQLFKKKKIGVETNIPQIVCVKVCTRELCVSFRPLLRHC